MAVAGWYRDPLGQGEARYWDGVRWTDSVSRGGYTVNSPIAPAQATVPPAPGSEYVASAPAPSQPATPNISVSSGGGDNSNGTVVAIVAGIAVIVAIIAIIVALSRNGDDDESPTTTGPPATTEAPPATDPPDTEAP